MTTEQEIAERVAKALENTIVMWSHTYWTEQGEQRFVDNEGIIAEQHGWMIGHVIDAEGKAYDFVFAGQDKNSPPTGFVDYSPKALKNPYEPQAAQGPREEAERARTQTP